MEDREVWHLPKTDRRVLSRLLERRVNLGAVPEQGMPYLSAATGALAVELLVAAKSPHKTWIVGY